MIVFPVCGAMFKGSQLEGGVKSSLPPLRALLSLSPVDVNSLNVDKICSFSVPRLNLSLFAKVSPYVPLFPRKQFGKFSIR